MWARMNELLFKKYFGTRPVTPLHNLYPSKPIFTRPKDGWTGGCLSAWPHVPNPPHQDLSLDLAIPLPPFHKSVKCCPFDLGERHWCLLVLDPDEDVDYLQTHFFLPIC